MSDDNFLRAYSELNPRQKEAVDSIEGPVMVIAGPGTGKTQILTLRAANILRSTDVPADAILALTFTEAAAANMRRRLTGLIGSRGYYVQISTFHGFCNRLIQEYPEHFPEIVGSESATEVEQISTLRRILEEGEYDILRPFGDRFFYVPDILSAVRKLKNEGFGAEEFAGKVVRDKAVLAAKPDLYHEKGAHKGKIKGEYRELAQALERNAELARVYAEYERTMRLAGRYDFEDMVLYVVRALETREDFLLEIQERYQYFLVDEHQDTNGAQNRVLELLASFYEEPNLFVVGDEKQAIFRFQGASLENFLYFERKYPRARLIRLESNYRSSQTILDSAQSLIDNNKATLKSPLRAERGGAEKPIEVVAFESPDGELSFISEEISKRLGAGAPPSEIAVLVRENKEARPVAEFLERRGVPVIVEADQNVLEEPEIRKLLLLFAAVESFGEDERLAEAMHLDFLGIAPLDIYKLVEAARERRTSLYKLISRPDDLRALDLDTAPAVASFFEVLSRLRRESRNKNFLEFFESAVRGSGFLNHLLALPGAWDKAEKLNTLFSEAKKMVGSRADYRPADFLDQIRILREHRVPIRAKFSPRTEAVRLLTAHKAKGLEFDSVFIPNAVDGNWGNRRYPERFKLPLRNFEWSGLEKNEDERRLFYMALTRARAEVVITYATRNQEGRERVPSQFLNEIRGDLKAESRGEEQKVFAFVSAKPADRAPAAGELEFVPRLFRERGISATGLNNFLECPWKYFYLNLIRLPRVQSRSEVYGSAVHAALQAFFEKKRHEPEAGEEYLLDRFRNALRKYPLPEREESLLAEKGERELRGYLAQYADAWNYNTLTELKIRVNLAPDVILNGKLDKLELQASTGEVIVVDYKTGRPKSRNWIEGKTADSTGNYKRQLIFYKLLLDLYPERRHRMTLGVIDFVEPNERGVFKKEAFEISAEETEELKKVIMSAADRIMNLKFWNERCGDKKCSYCALRNLSS